MKHTGYLKIKGNKLPVRISFMALNWFSNNNGGKGFETIKEYKIDHFIELIYYGLHAAAMHEKTDLEYSIDELYCDIDNDHNILNQINKMFLSNVNDETIGADIEKPMEAKKN